MHQVLKDYRYQITVYLNKPAYEREVEKTVTGDISATSSTSAKSKLTKIINSMKLFEYVQYWDNEKVEYTGKDLHWKAWSKEEEGKSKEGIPIIITTKRSERAYANDDYYTVSVCLFRRK